LGIPDFVRHVLKVDSALDNDGDVTELQLQKLGMDYAILGVLARAISKAFQVCF
jgi:hypothetical protein